MSSSRFTAILLSVAGPLLAGCAPSRVSHDAGGTGSSATSAAAAKAIADAPSSRTPSQNLQALAMKEVAAPAKEVAPPLPPGVEPTALARRSADDPRAFLSFQDALQALVSAPANSSAAMLPSPPPSADQKAEALMHYAKGRAASLDGRHLQAITELRKAQQLDPDSPPVLRELARSYGLVGNQTKAMELYDQLASLDPENTEAVFTLGLAAAGRREFGKAAAMLGRLRLAEKSFDHDPAADIIADFTLAAALRELGYDRASIEAATRSLNLPERLSAPTEHAPRIESIFRQRGETWRAIGDAHSRLGEHESALAAFANARTLPAADPGVLDARIIYSNLCQGRRFNAQYQLLSTVSAEQRGVSDRAIGLGAYVRENAAPVTLLADAVAALSASRPEDSSYARLAAALASPEQGAAALRGFVNRRPRDLDAVGQMMGWLAQHELPGAVSLAVGLATDHPDLTEGYADRLSVAVINPTLAIEALQSMQASAARARMMAHLMRKSGGAGEAWAVCAEARKRWPDDAGLMLQQLQLAAAMQERALFEQTLATAHGLNDVPSLIAISQYWRALGAVEKAVQLAQRAADMDGGSFDAMVEVARAEGAQAAVLSADAVRKPLAKAHVDAALRYAELAIALQPARDEPYEVLALLHAPSGALADTALLRQTLQRLRQANPQSTLAARLAAQEAIEQRRYAQALERLLPLCEANPADGQSLALAVTAWQRADRLDAAEDWLARRLEARPGDPNLTEQWVRVQLLRDRAPAAIRRLQDTLASNAADLAARRLLEGVYRAAGQADAALELGEKRLLARPVGLRREMELAALYGGAELGDKAFERLDWLDAHTDQANQDELTAIIAVASRIDSDAARRDAMTIDLVNRTIGRFPAATLDVYQFGLKALARSGRVDESFDALVARAVRDAAGARGTDGAGVMPWRALAQGLIDAGHPEAAARALRARLWAEPRLTDQSLAWIARMTLLADAAADAAQPKAGRTESEHAKRSIELIDRLGETDALTMTLAMEDTPSLAAAYYESSIHYSMLDAKLGAEHMLRRALVRQPDYSMAMNNLGYMLLEQGRSDPETIHFIEQAHAMEPDQPDILDSIGWLRYLQGRLTDEPDPTGAARLGAVSLLRKSAGLGRGRRGSAADAASPTVLDHLGDALWAAGDREKAVETWREARGIVEDPGFRDLIVQQFHLVQTRIWQLVVIDPRVMYDREYGGLLESVRQKLDAAEHDRQPAVATQWNQQHP